MLTRDEIELLLGVAEATARLSRCTRSKVGAVLVQPDGQIIGSGFNHIQRSGPQCDAGGCPRGQLTYDQLPANAPYTNCPARHAEVIAIMRSEYILPGSILVSSRQPCPECSSYLHSRKHRISWLVYPTGKWVHMMDQATGSITDTWRRSSTNGS